MLALKDTFKAITKSKKVTQQEMAEALGIRYREIPFHLMNWLK